MAGKIKIPFCLFGKIRDVDLFNDAMKYLIREIIFIVSGRL